MVHTLEGFKKLLGSHDITWMYSDNIEVAAHGQEQLLEIIETKKALTKFYPEEELDALWNEFVDSHGFDEEEAKQFYWNKE